MNPVWITLKICFVFKKDRKSTKRLFFAQKLSPVLHLNVPSLTRTFHDVVVVFVDVVDVDGAHQNVAKLKSKGGLW